MENREKTTSSPARSGVQHMGPTRQRDAVGNGARRSSGQRWPSVEYCTRITPCATVTRSQKPSGMAGAMLTAQSDFSKVNTLLNSSWPSEN